MKVQAFFRSGSITMLTRLTVGSDLVPVRKWNYNCYDCGQRQGLSLQSMVSVNMVLLQTQEIEGGNFCTNKE